MHEDGKTYGPFDRYVSVGLEPWGLEEPTLDSMAELPASVHTLFATRLGRGSGNLGR
jgi:hypothetical protein